MHEKGPKAIPLMGEVIGLKNKPTLVKCPSCETQALSDVRQEVVSCYQKSVSFLWCFLGVICNDGESVREPPCDINHYCSYCGCYLGRFRIRKDNETL